MTPYEQDVAQGIAQTYRAVNRPIPEIIFASSPPVGAFMAPMLAHTDPLNETSIRQVKDDAHELCFGNPKAKLVDKYRDVLSHDKKSGAGAHVSQPGQLSFNFKHREQLRSLLPVRGEGVLALPNPISGAVNRSVRDKLHKLFLRRVKYHYLITPMRELFTLRSDCMGLWPNKRFAVACAQPTTLLLNNNRQLHSKTGLAITYSDGWGVAAINGIEVPEQYVRDRNLLTTKVIDDESNTEVRRALIELYGYEKWLQDVKAVALDADVDADGHPRRLWSIDGPVKPTAAYLPESWFTDDLRWRPGRYVLEVVNSTPEADGTFKKYFLPVPGNSSMSTVKAAMRWIVGNNTDMEFEIET